MDNLQHNHLNFFCKKCIRVSNLTHQEIAFWTYTMCFSLSPCRFFPWQRRVVLLVHQRHELREYAVSFLPLQLHFARSLLHRGLRGGQEKAQRHQPSKRDTSGLGAVVGRRFAQFKTYTYSRKESKVFVANSWPYGSFRSMSTYLTYISALSFKHRFRFLFISTKIIYLA